MGNMAGRVLLIVLAALALGVTVTEPKARLKVAGGALALFLLYAAWDPLVDAGPAIYLYVLMFFLPFSFGSWMQRRVGRRKK